MERFKVFISSVQKEFKDDRIILKNYLNSDSLLRRFFEVFLFEELPAQDRNAQNVYLDEVEKSAVYVGLFGYEYGWEDKRGISPTQHEFELATKLNKHRLIFIKGTDDDNRHPKMQKLVRMAGKHVIRRRFATASELISNLYASLVQFLEDKEIISSLPFDARFCRNAELSDLDDERIEKFLGLARRARGFPLPEDSKPEEVLTHLNLLNNGRPTHAAILLFGKKPQRFLISSEIKCAHFHGTEVAKPIPSYQVYKGTVFDLVDQAVDFVMSKINLAIGTRALSVQVPVEYEIPREVVYEAIVNAVAHRDYTSNGSVQVMLFSDRLEVWNPGTLPSGITLEKLRKPHGSVPGNPLLAEPLYLTKYIERMGTGTRDMIERCHKAGLGGPEFTLTDGFVVTVRRKPGRAFEAVGGISTEQVTEPESQPESQPESMNIRIVNLLGKNSLGKIELSQKLGQKEISGHLNKTIRLLLSDALIEMTMPDKPNSRLQKYRLTEKGKKYLKTLEKK